MPAPLIYRSTDVGAPALFGGGGSLTTVLDAILVNGYGSLFATGLITNDGTNVSDGDILTVGSITYTFRTSIAGQPAYSIAIGGTVNQTSVRLTNAINANGAVGSDYTAGTLPNPDVWASNVSGSTFPVTLTARRGGTAGNSLALVRTSSVTPHISVSGSFMTGGSGTNTIAPAGWPKPYTDPTNWTRVVYKQPAGCGFYLELADDNSAVGLGREARFAGFETMTAYGVGTGQFPSTAFVASGAVPARKSNSSDGVQRPWVVFVDDRTLYLFMASGDASSNYHGFAFGDFYSLGATDPYKCFIMGGAAETSAGAQGSDFAVQSISSSLFGHYLARNYTGIGGATGFIKVGDYGMAQAPNFAGMASMGFPNPIDGGLYIAPVRIFDAGTPGLNLTGTRNLRGRLRGFFHICHPVANFSDGDVFSGVGEYAGRNFVIMRYVYGSSSNQSFLAIETTAWDTSA